MQFWKLRPTLFYPRPLYFGAIVRHFSVFDQQIPPGWFSNQIRQTMTGCELGAALLVGDYDLARVLWRGSLRAAEWAVALASTQATRLVCELWVYYDRLCVIAGRSRLPVRSSEGFCGQWFGSRMPTRRASRFQ